MSDLEFDDAARITEPIYLVLKDHETRLKRIEELIQASIEEPEETISIVMLRVIEHGGRIYQQELQRVLGIRSRTTMSKLAHKLVETGKFRICRVGRRNIIEVVSDGNA